MLANQRKKGFTVVELVIVIAVIAILAAVLIPTFTNIINKADTAADMQTVRNLNSIVAAEGAAVGGIKTAHDAIVAAAANGYDLEHITPTADGRTIVWDGDNFCFALISDSKVVFPGDNVRKLNTPKANLFVVSDTYPATDYTGYGVYLTEACTLTEINATTGVDVGYNTEIVKVNYTGTDEVIVRTNAELCSFTMSEGTVNHYGVALNAVVTGGTYNCYATLSDGQYASADEITEDFAGGKGTEESPYLVATEEHLINLESFSGRTTHFKLMNDITFTTNEDEDGPYGYIYTYFQGVLDGNGHSIINANSDTTAPCLFYGSYYGDTVIKNLNYVVASDVVKPLFYRNYSGGKCDGTALTIENVTVKGAEDKMYDLCGYGSSAFMLANCGAVYFKNCVNEVSYTIPGSGYAGIFIGNYGFEETFASFENCVNKGTINGVYPSFFCGNENKNVELTDSNATPVFSSTAQVFYINNCSNEGAIIGSTAVGALGCNWPDNDTTHDICEASLTDAQFHRGTMLVANIDIGLTIADKTVQVVGSDDPNVDSYAVSFKVYVDFENGNSQFTYAEKLTKEEVISGKTVANVSSVITKADYEAAGGTYNTAEEKVSGTFKFVVVNNADGTRTIVIDMSGWSDFKNFGDVEHNVSAYNANGQRIGFKEYR